MRAYFIIVLLIAYAAAAAEQGRNNRISSSATSTNIITNIVDLKATTNSADSDGAYLLEEKHLLEPGDVISFRIIKDKKPLINLTVTDSSELDVPYLGRVSVAGKSCRQLAAELKVQLEKDYYYRATVMIGLDSVNKMRGQVFVWGQVRNEGPIEIVFNHDLSLGEAILRSGGFSEYADKKKVKVVRTHGVLGGAKTIIVVNMAEVMEKGNVEKDIMLEPGDLIIVPSRLINF